ncbi:MAG TPA: hypothetical protein VFF50_14045 [Candidatus Deferrimicrobiaceae bacterium]|nr:hypothetical protein [Candidatus Deferrimicrobiaceae bacterium]
MHPSQFDGRDQVVTAKVVSLSTLVAVTLVVRYMDGRENDGSLERGARPQCSPGSATRQVSRRNPEDK